MRRMRRTVDNIPGPLDVLIIGFLVFGFFFAMIALPFACGEVRVKSQMDAGVKK